MTGRPLLVAVLAAGLASRFGGGKLDADCGGQMVGSRVLQAVDKAGLPPGVVVIGAVQPRFCAARPDWRCVVNPDAESGLGTSVALAAKAAISGACDLLLVLADMPLVTPFHMTALARSPHACATRYASGKPGVPARIPFESLDEFAHLTGGEGAAQLLATLPNLALVTTDPATLGDVDTPADLAQIDRFLRSGNTT